METKREYTIREEREESAALREALARLLPQLSPGMVAPSAGRLREMLASPTTSLLAVWAAGRIEGVLTLAWYDTPSGRKAWIEDVVVDASLRGCGAGRELVARALRRCEEVGASQVMLTSAPKREAARALYRKMGFEEAMTTLFVCRKANQE